MLNVLQSIYYCVKYVVLWTLVISIPILVALSILGDAVDPEPTMKCQTLETGEQLCTWKGYFWVTR